MTTLLAAPAASTTVTAPSLKEEAFGPIYPFRKCFVSHEDFAASRPMKALLIKHPSAAQAPIIADTYVCGHDESFGLNLVKTIKHMMTKSNSTGFFIVSHRYGLTYHEMSPIWEQHLVTRSSHRCS